MLLRHWLADLGVRSLERCSLAEVKRFTFGADAYTVEMMDGRTFQDNDLERMLLVIYDEFNTFNTTHVFKSGDSRKQLYPLVDYKGRATRMDPLGQRSAMEMIVTAVEWTNTVPPMDLEALVGMLRDRVTLFNLTGEWTSFTKDNL